MFTEKEINFIKTNMTTNIPIIIKNDKLTKVFKILIKKSYRLIELHNFIKNKLQLDKHEQILFFIGSKLLRIDNTTLETIYLVYKNSDEILNIYFEVEKVFGY